MNEVLEFLSTSWAQILGVLILATMYKLGFLAVREQKMMASKHISCGSPDCVRCRTYRSGFMEHLSQDWLRYETRLPETVRQRVSRVSRTISRYAPEIGAKGRSVFALLDLQTKPYYDRKSFESDVELLESNWPDIYSEYFELQKTQEVDGGWKINTTTTGKWSAFYLVNQGVQIKHNIARCPKTYAVLTNLNNFMGNCIFTNACFSVVHPGTHITEHYGPCNLRVRCHLGLDVPDACELLVDGVGRSWSRGKCLLFDDSYLHSVTHRGSDMASKPRVVFLLDFWNPNLSYAEINALNYLFHSHKIDFVS